jgi:hypothetical protein
MIFKAQRQCDTQHKLLHVAYLQISATLQEPELCIQYSPHSLSRRYLAAGIASSNPLRAQLFNFCICYVLRR